MLTRAFNKNRTYLLTVMAAGALIASGCEIDQTQEGQLPSIDIDADAGALPDYEVVKTDDGKMPGVDVDVTSGQMPAFDVDGPDISINKKSVTVSVPEVEVKKKEKTISVPTIDIDLPSNEDEKGDLIDDK